MYRKSSTRAGVQYNTAWRHGVWSTTIPALIQFRITLVRAPRVNKSRIDFVLACPRIQHYSITLCAGRPEGEIEEGGEGDADAGLILPGDRRRDCRRRASDGRSPRWHATPPHVGRRYEYAAHAPTPPLFPNQQQTGGYPLYATAPLALLHIDHVRSVQ